MMSMTGELTQGTIINLPRSFGTYRHIYKIHSVAIHIVFLSAPYDETIFSVYTLRLVAFFLIGGIGNRTEKVQYLTSFLCIREKRRQQSVVS